MPSKKIKKRNSLWSSRFNEPVSDTVKKFNASVGYDYQLAKYDIQGSLAHAAMLAEQKIISARDLAQIKKGLRQVEKEVNKGEFKWSIEYEDVHSNIEHRLIEIVGEAGKKLHTGRSRNDQVATDIRLFLRDKVYDLVKVTHNLQITIVNLANEHVDTIMPGFTHLQIAQPISFAHHLMAYYEMLKRDKERVVDSLKRLNTMPLGSAALAGTSYPIDRKITASLLGFDRISSNSIDAVSDRDFAIEFCSNASIIMMHLSRFSEEIILWMNPNFNFVTLSDKLCTGSSIMPQKKNPDVPELVRGKTGRVFGNLLSLLTIMKGQPLAYNKDNQEDKEPIFDTVDTTITSLILFEEIVKNLKIKSDEMKSSLNRGHVTATDLADFMVSKGVSFKEAHGVVAKAVNFAEKLGIDLSAVPTKELQKISPIIDDSVPRLITLENSLNSRNHQGGTGAKAVKKAIKNANKDLENLLPRL